MSFIFSKIQTKEEKNWPCFREPFTSNLCLFSFFFFFLFLLFCPLLPVYSSTLCYLVFTSVLPVVFPFVCFFPPSSHCPLLWSFSVQQLPFFYMSGTRSSHTHTHVHHSSCISRSLCDPSLRVHTDSPLRCSQILAVALASHRAPGRAAQRKHTRAPAHASARAHTHKDEHGHAQLRRSTLGGHNYRAVHMHTLEQGGVGE